MKTRWDFQRDLLIFSRLIFESMFCDGTQFHASPAAPERGPVLVQCCSYFPFRDDMRRWPTVDLVTLRLGRGASFIQRIERKAPSLRDDGPLDHVSAVRDVYFHSSSGPNSRTHDLGAGAGGLVVTLMRTRRRTTLICWHPCDSSSAFIHSFPNRGHGEFQAGQYGHLPGRKSVSAPPVTWGGMWPSSVKPRMGRFFNAEDETLDDAFEVVAAAMATVRSLLASTLRETYSMRGHRRASEDDEEVIRRMSSPRMQLNQPPTAMAMPTLRGTKGLVSETISLASYFSDPRHFLRLFTQLLGQCANSAARGRAAVASCLTTQLLRHHRWFATVTVDATARRARTRPPSCGKLQTRRLPRFHRKRSTW